MAVRQIIATAALAVATLATPVAIAQQADAAPDAGPTGSCTGGTTNTTMNPLGLFPTPLNARTTGGANGCTGNFGPSLSFDSRVTTGGASCWDVPAVFDGIINWGNGERSHAVGPFHVVGGIGNHPNSNTLTIVDGWGRGGKVTIRDKGAMDTMGFGVMVGPCMASALNSMRLDLVGVDVRS